MPRIHHPTLTDPQIRAMPPGPIPYDRRDGGARGLVLSVLPDGRKRWTVRYVYQGKHKRHVLGEFPKLSLAKAREAAGSARQRILSGHDPAGEVKAKKAIPTDTVAALAAEYLAEYAKAKRSAAEDARILERDVLPHWKDRSVRSLTRRDVKKLVSDIAARAPVMSNRVLAVVRKMLNYAIDSDDWHVDANPAARVTKQTETERERVLSPDEIRRLWRCLGRFPTTAERQAPQRKKATGTPDDPICPVSLPLAALLRLRLLSAQRGGEVAQMKWADLELPETPDAGGWWTIPGSDTKNGVTHRVWLVADAVALIEAQRPTQADGTPDPRPAGFVFTNRDGGATVAARAKKAPARLSRVLGFAFRGHDLRRTAASGMGEAGIPREQIAYVLNHADGSPRATRIYDRFSRDTEKRRALETWARKLTAILASTSARGGVVPFVKGA